MLFLQIPGSLNTTLPYYVIDDSAYPLRPWLMKSYIEQGGTTSEILFSKVDLVCF